MSGFFISGGQSIGASASTSVFPMNIQDWFPFGVTRLIFLQSKGLSRVLSMVLSFFFMVQVSLSYMTTRKTIALTTWTFVGKVMSLLFNTLSRLVIAFLPRSKRLLISWLQSPSAVIWSPRMRFYILGLQITSRKWWDQMPWPFLNVEFSASFFSLLFHLHQEAL